MLSANVCMRTKYKKKYHTFHPFLCQIKPLLFLGSIKNVFVICILYFRSFVKTNRQVEQALAHDQIHMCIIWSARDALTTFTRILFLRSIAYQMLDPQQKRNTCSYIQCADHDVLSDCHNFECAWPPEGQCWLCLSGLYECLYAIIRYSKLNHMDIHTQRWDALTSRTIHAIIKVMQFEYQMCGVRKITIRILNA